MFCPFLPLIAAGKNIVTFAVKLVSENNATRSHSLSLSDLTQFPTTKVRTRLESGSSTLHLHDCSSVLLRMGSPSHHLFCNIVGFQYRLIRGYDEIQEYFCLN